MPRELIRIRPISSTASLDIRTMIARYTLLLLAVFLAACSNIPSYTGPRTSEVLATIERFGGGNGLCGLTVAFTGNPICHAGVSAVDGRMGDMWAPSIEVDPGERSLNVSCSMAFGPSPDNRRWYFASLSANLKAGGTYRVEAAWDTYCRMWLVDATTGKVIAGDPPADSK